MYLEYIEEAVYAEKQIHESNDWKIIDACFIQNDEVILVSKVANSWRMKVYEILSTFLHRKIKDALCSFRELIVALRGIVHS